MNIVYYKTFSGRIPVKEYVYSLPKADIEAITADFEIIRDRGILSNTVETRKLKEKLWEIKTGTRHQQRIFYCLVSDEGIVLLHACKKQKEGAQRGDVELAYKRMKEILK
jgi:phage-related protein